MTKDYSHAISWIENHNNPDNYGDNEYEDWLQANKEAFGTPNLFNEPDFMFSLNDLWNTYHKEEEIDNVAVSDESSRIDLGNTRVTNRTTITPSQTPVRIESRSPITITPVEPIIEKKEEPIPVIVATPANIPTPQKQSIFRRFLGLFRRRR